MEGFEHFGGSQMQNCKTLTIVTMLLKLLLKKKIKEQVLKVMAQSERKSPSVKLQLYLRNDAA